MAFCLLWAASRLLALLVAWQLPLSMAIIPISDDPADRAALIDLYTSTGGPRWRHQQGWLVQDQSMCSWHGIVCNGSVVSRILLDDNLLEGALPASLCTMSRYLRTISVATNRVYSFPDCPDGSLPGLWYLNMSFTHLNGVWPPVCKYKTLRLLNVVGTGQLMLPSCVGYLKDMEHLSLEVNGLTTLPDSVCWLRKLVYIYLEDNWLTHLPACFGHNQTQAQLLAVSNNRLQELPDGVCNMASLRTIQGFANKLQRLPRCLSRLTKSVGWYFSNNEIAELPTFEHVMPYFRSLFLDTNRVTQLPSNLGLQTSLSFLNLPFNHLSTLPSELGNLTKMISLVLNGNRLSAFPREILGFRNMTRLNLASNRITDVSAFNDADLPNLLNLRLSNNNISTMWTRNSMPKLEVLELDHNRLTIFPLDAFFIRTLLKVDVSYNLINFTFPYYNESDAIGKNCIATGLESKALSVSVSHNRLGGHLMAWLDCLSNFRSLALLDLSFNRISGSFDARLSDLPASPFRGLISLNMSYNNLNGEMLLYDPYDLSPLLSTVDISGNPHYVRNTANFHVLWTPDFVERFVDADTGLLCPTWRWKGAKQAKLQTSAVFFLYENCTCPEKMYWVPALASCLPCPPHVGCPLAVSNPVQIAVEPGYYPLSLSTGGLGSFDSRDVKVLRCHVAALCNPQQAVEYQCADGADRSSLMCSKCLDGYYNSFDACHKCYSYLQYLLPLVDALALALIILFLHYRDWNDDRATLQIALFYLQLTEALEQSALRRTASGGSHWQGIEWLQAVANLGPWGLSCVLPGTAYVQEYWTVVLSPVAVLVVGWCCKQVAAIRRRRQGKLDDAERRRSAKTAIPMRRTSFRRESEMKAMQRSEVSTSVQQGDGAGEVSAVRSANVLSDKRGSVDRGAGLDEARLDARALALQDAALPRRVSVSGNSMASDNSDSVQSMDSMSSVLWSTRRRRRTMVDRMMTTTYFLLYVLYLPVSRFVMNTFNCQTLTLKDGRTLRFLSIAPYIECRGMHYNLMLAGSVVMFLGFVLGLPLYFFLRVWPHLQPYSTKPSRDFQLLRAELLFLWSTVVDRYRLWELTVISSRRLLVATLVSVLPFGSVFVPLSIMLLLFAAIMLQLAFRPYRNEFDNRLEIVLLFIALVSYQAQVLTSTNSQFISVASVRDVVRVSNDVVKVALVCLLVRLYVVRRVEKVVHRVRTKVLEVPHVSIPRLPNGATAGRIGWWSRGGRSGVESTTTTTTTTTTTQPDDVDEYEIWRSLDADERADSGAYSRSNNKQLQEPLLNA